MSVPTIASLFIDGSFSHAHNGATLAVASPSSGRPLAQVSAASAEDAARAVSAARAAFPAWSATPAGVRANVLRALAAKITENKAALARLEAEDNGKPITEAEFDVADAAKCFEHFASLADRLVDEVEHVDVGDPLFSCRVVREPMGAVGCILPFNFPLLMAAWKVAPALAAGCTIVLKPSELTPLTAIELAKLSIAAGVPPGVLNVLTGGPEAGAALVDDTRLAKIAFTGSLATGQHVMRGCANGVRNVTLELGGKSPLVIFDDADIEVAVEWIMVGIFFNQGEVCSATSRVLLQRGIAQRVLDRLVLEAEKLRVGDPLDPNTQMGAIVSQRQMAKVLDMIAEGRRTAKLLTGGNRIERDGNFVQPTVFADVPIDSQIWREEIFGPVVCTRVFDTEAEAIELANDSEFGLAAAVISKDMDRCERVARAFRAGIVWINASQPTFCQAPWGGFKRSGIGRELGRWGLSNFLEVKQMLTYDNSTPFGYYIPAKANL